MATCHYPAVLGLLESGARQAAVWVKWCDAPARILTEAAVCVCCCVSCCMQHVQLGGMVIL